MCHLFFYNSALCCLRTASAQSTRQCGFHKPFQCLNPVIMCPIHDTEKQPFLFHVRHTSRRSGPFIVLVLIYAKTVIVCNSCLQRLRNHHEPFPKNRYFLIKLLIEFRPQSAKETFCPVCATQNHPSPQAPAPQPAPTKSARDALSGRHR